MRKKWTNDISGSGTPEGAVEGRDNQVNVAQPKASEVYCIVADYTPLEAGFHHCDELRLHVEYNRINSGLVWRELPRNGVGTSDICAVAIVFSPCIYEDEVIAARDGRVLLPGQRLGICCVMENSRMVSSPYYRIICLELKAEYVLVGLSFLLGISSSYLQAKLYPMNLLAREYSYNSWSTLCMRETCASLCISHENK